MGQRGPKPAPATVHRLRGNPSKIPDHILDKELTVDVEKPSCPNHLSKPAKAEWKRIIVHLEKYGLISQLDRAALAVYCQAYGRWVEAENKIKELGEEGGLIIYTQSGYQQISVWLQISKKAVEQMKAFVGEFGLSPSSRTRINPSPNQKKKDDDSDSAAKYF